MCDSWSAVNTAKVPSERSTVSQVLSNRSELTISKFLPNGKALTLSGRGCKREPTFVYAARVNQHVTTLRRCYFAVNVWRVPRCDNLDGLHTCRFSSKASSASVLRMPTVAKHVMQIESYDPSALWW